MPNIRGYRVPGGDSDARVWEHLDDLAVDVADDVTTVEQSLRATVSAVERDLQADVSDASQAARDYTEAVLYNAINVTGLALDTDGTPCFSPGSMNPRVLADTDGIPYFREL